VSGTHHRSCLGIFASVQFALWFRELKTRHAGSRLGWAWNLIGPVILVTVFTVIAGVHGKNLMYGIDYPMYVLTGWVPYHMSIHSLQLGMGAAKSNSGLFIYRQVKPFDVILARVLQTFIIDTIVLIVLVSVAGWVGYRIVPNDPLLLLVLWVAFGAFTLGLALCLAVLQHLS
jgi:capsular polysaccharide transport system permease protein